jgi:hypothetical protein
MKLEFIDRIFPPKRDALKEAGDLGLQPMCDRCHLEIDRCERFRERQRGGFRSGDELESYRTKASQAFSRIFTRWMPANTDPQRSRSLNKSIIMKIIIEI